MTIRKVCFSIDKMQERAKSSLSVTRLRTRLPRPALFTLHLRLDTITIISGYTSSSSTSTPTCLQTILAEARANPHSQQRTPPPQAQSRTVTYPTSTPSLPSFLPILPTSKTSCA